MTKKEKVLFTACSTMAVLLGCSCLSYAETGVPMLAVMWPVSWYLLLPMIVFEAWIACRMLGVDTLKKNLMASAAANALSTLIGIPLVWTVLLEIEITVSIPTDLYGLETFWGKVIAVTHQAPWLLPYESDMYWLVPVAAMVLLIPFFFMSVFAERWMFRLITRCPKEIGRRWSWMANGITYGIVMLGLAVWLVVGILEQG